MLLRYYLTASIVSICLFAIGQPGWALLPLGLMIILFAASIQSTQPSIKSLQQFTIDNVMLLSLVALMIGVVRLMYLSGVDIILSSMIVCIATLVIYCVSLIADYEDGIIVRHQSFVLSVVGVIITSFVQLSLDYSQIQTYLGLITVMFVICTCICTVYWTMSSHFKLQLPHQITDYTIIGWSIIVPSFVIVTIFYNDILLACMMILSLYALYGRLLSYYDDYFGEIENTEEVTLDLILKGYKTSVIKAYTESSRLNHLINHIKNISPTIYRGYRHIPDLVISIAYMYLMIQLMSTGIKVSDFIIYCLALGTYVGLYYLYQQNSIIRLDNIALAVIICYLSVVALMMTVFSEDAITGSIVGFIWIIINAIIAAQYQSLNLADYIRPHHLQRRIRANTVGAVIIVITLTQLPIDTIMIIPLMLIVTALLGFTVAQSYISLRKVGV